MRLYADAAALAAYPGGSAVPAESVDALLRTASRVVDQLLRGIVYDTDPATLLPTDPDVAGALEDAACAIAVEAHATGALAAGGTQEWDSVKLATVALSGRKSRSGSLTVAGVPVPTAALVALADVGPLVVLS